MKAVICNRYGSADVLRIKEVPKPEPKDDEMLVEIRSSAVTNSDIFIRSSRLPFPIVIPFRIMIGIFKPRKSIIGLVFSGVVKSVGPKIKRFSAGDEVYGMTGFNLGAYAEFTCIKETDSVTGCVSLKPKNITHEEATSAVYGGSLALQYMDKGKIKKNQNILIYGASGTSGTIAVQYGKYLGANVTGVCSGRNVDFIKSLGADNTIDYTATDKLEDETYFDFILDSVGKQKSSTLKENCKKALTEDGEYVSIDNGDLKLSSKRLDFLTKLIEEENIKPIVDKVYSLDDIVEAHKYVEKGHKRGGVAIRMEKMYDDVYLRDSLADTGIGQMENGLSSLSPDIIVRKTPYENLEEISDTANWGRDLSEGLKSSQPGYIYLRGKNLGVTSSSNVTFYLYHTRSSLILWPDTWINNPVKTVVGRDSCLIGQVKSHGMAVTSDPFLLSGDSHSLIGRVSTDKNPATLPSNINCMEDLSNFIQSKRNIAYRNVRAINPDMTSFSTSVDFSQGVEEEKLSFQLNCYGLPVGSEVSFYAGNPGTTPELKLEKAVVTNSDNFSVGIHVSVHADYQSIITYSYDSKGNTITNPSAFKIELQVYYAKTEDRLGLDPRPAGPTKEVCIGSHSTILKD